MKHVPPLLSLIILFLLELYLANLTNQLRKNEAKTRVDFGELSDRVVTLQTAIAVHQDILNLMIEDAKRKKKGAGDPSL